MRGALLTVERRASLALLFAAPLLFVGSPSLLPIRVVGIAIISLANLVYAADANRLTAEVLLVPGPANCPMRSPGRAIEAGAALVLVLAAPRLFGLQPQLLPMGETDVAIVRRRRRRARNPTMRATPFLLGGGPTEGRVRGTFLAIPGTARFALLRAAPRLLLGGPKLLPSREARLAIVPLAFHHGFATDASRLAAEFLLRA
mmetsp:Transcript_41330/g.124746  ORF Transcript_41330/g.124746 Transcript_41330/m.124746 type:complete len:202 (+) Transcript_41330:1303-1908(+)